MANSYNVIHGHRYNQVHLSHATIFSRQNRGMDSIGVRLLYRLP